MRIGPILILSIAELSLADVFTSRLSRYGYSGKIYKIKSEDGYTLKLHRIPPSVKSSKTPVLMIHGLMASSDSYIVIGPKAGLPYQLADQGYDVWLANSRGNMHGREHETLSPTSASFWNYTFHEIAVFDLPPTIDFIRKTTNHKKVHLIGHSQGSTVILVLLAERPEFNDYVESGTLLAPVAFLGNLRKKPRQTILDKLFISYVAHNVGKSKENVDTEATFEVGRYNENFGLLLTFLCKSHIEFCQTFFEMAGLVGRSQFNSSVLEDVVSVAPCGASINQFVHYSQLLNSNEFRQFDWGERRNLLKYGTKTPPDYKLENIKAPLNVFYSDIDIFIHWPDIDRLLKRLSNVKFVKFIQHIDWMHFDYLIGNNLTNVINKDVIKLLNKS